MKADNKIDNYNEFAQWFVSIFGILIMSALVMPILNINNSWQLTVFIINIVAYVVIVVCLFLNVFTKYLKRDKERVKSKEEKQKLYYRIIIVGIGIVGVICVWLRFSVNNILLNILWYAGMGLVLISLILFLIDNYKENAKRLNKKTN